ncbi:MAG: hypothetical protein IJY15_10805, partial [Thermoguttaceae bacterium]|nr:hypothetical protein [Thermoguttaceae bacterium]
GVFVRTIAKMERDAVESAFAKFLDWSLSGEQIAFLQRVVNYVVDNGFVEPRDLVKAPFDPSEIHRIFNQIEKGKIRDALERMNANAVDVA